MALFYYPASVSVTGSSSGTVNLNLFNRPCLVRRFLIELTSLNATVEITRSDGDSFTRGPVRAALLGAVARGNALGEYAGPIQFQAPGNLTLTITVTDASGATNEASFLAEILTRG